MSKLRIAVLVIAILGITFTSYKIISTYLQYNAASKEYEQLDNYTVPSVKEDTSEVDLTEKKEINEEEKRKELTVNTNRMDFPDLEVDYNGLYSINHDYVGWLYVGGVGISYPVVQGMDNDFYLHKTFEKENNFAGCIFIDCEDKPDFSMFNTFVYGHAMKNGTMFGNLKQFKKDPAKYDKDPYIYMFLKDGIYRYKIYSYYIDEKNSDMYYSSDNLKEYRQYIREALDKSVRDCDVKPDEEDNSITLVTCSGTASNKQRFFVHGIFIDYYKYE